MVIATKSTEQRPDWSGRWGRDKDQPGFGRRTQQPKRLATQFIQPEDGAHRNQRHRCAIAGQRGTVAGGHQDGGNRPLILPVTAPSRRLARGIKHLGTAVSRQTL